MTRTGNNASDSLNNLKVRLLIYTIVCRQNISLGYAGFCNTIFSVFLIFYPIYSSQLLVRNLHCLLSVKKPGFSIRNL